MLGAIGVHPHPAKMLNIKQLLSSVLDSDGQKTHHSFIRHAPTGYLLLGARDAKLPEQKEDAFAEDLPRSTGGTEQPMSVAGVPGEGLS